MALADKIPTTGTELDELWIAVFQCVIQLVISANKNIKQHYIAISAKANHSAAEIVRAIEQAVKKQVNGSGGLPVGKDSLVRAKIRDLCRAITIDFPKQLITSTRMAIGVWPPPNAVSEMILEASSLASSCKELVSLGNSLGYFPILDKVFDVSVRLHSKVLISLVSTI